MTSKPCSKPGCEKLATRRGLCHADYMAHMTRQMAYGRWESGYVDAQPAREHVAQLRAAGMGTRTIAQTAGISRTILQCLIHGNPRPGAERRDPPSKTIARYNAEKILAVPIPDDVRDGSGNINAVGTRRRLQALIAYGYSQRDISRRLGYAADNLTSIVNGSIDAVKPSARDRVASLFSELQVTPGGCARSRNRGRVKRWPLPLDWDEDTIDDPSAEATRSVIRRYDPRHDVEKIADRRSRVAKLLDAGLSAPEIAVQLHCSVRTIERDKTAIREADSLSVAS